MQDGVSDRETARCLSFRAMKNSRDRLLVANRRFERRSPCAYQVSLFSATIPKWVDGLVSKKMKDPQWIRTPQHTLFF